MTFRPTTYDELMDVQHLAAINVTGADHSSWNGKLGKPAEPSKDGEIVLGTAGWDHSILHHEEYVEKPLRQMFQQRGRQHDDHTLLVFHTAVEVVFHENLHMLARHGTEHRDGKTWYKYAAYKALELGR
jgi:hypothetical protein